MSDMLFPDAAPPKNSEDELIVAAYLKVGRTLDDLAYTDDFDALYNMLSRNPMSYSEKEGFVRQSLADESKRSAQTVRDKKDNLKKDWDI